VNGSGGSQEHPFEPAPADTHDEWAVTSAQTRPVHLAGCPLISTAERHAYAAEQYRIARTKAVQLLRKPFRVVVTSPSIGDGKTVSAVNLAVAFSIRSQARTLLIDADLRRAGVQRLLQVPLEPGLADVLAGRCRLGEAVFIAKELPGLYVLTAGLSFGSPTELLASPRWQALAEAVQRQFAHVIVDSPPVEIVADFDLIAAACDGVVLVIRPDHTNRTLALAAMEKLQSKLVGVLINAAPDWFLGNRPARHDYYYYRPDTKTGRQAEDRESD
jgi:tyrosine-protein kinase Etk/Wzc